jgi:hypothetical protein
MVEAVNVLLSMRCHSRSPPAAIPSLTGADHTPETSPRKRTYKQARRDEAEADVQRKRVCFPSAGAATKQRFTPTTIGPKAIKQAASTTSTPQKQSPVSGADCTQKAPADFFIDGSQGQLAVCERKSVVRDGAALPYLLVRLRGQSNTLPHDASLNVRFNAAHTDRTIHVHIARVRIKAGSLKYDFLPEPVQLQKTSGSDGSYSSPLLASIFSKKCWSGVVVRGPRMFVAFLSGQPQTHSLPMFVEISPTSNSPGYRDPVMEYPSELLRSFFHPNTFAQLLKMHSSSRRLNF